jgi:CubicO group peptidase (beta-lactamase class C family)
MRLNTVNQIILFGFILFVLPLVQAQQLDLGRLNAYVSKSVVEHQLPGLAIGIVQDGEILFQQGYGVCKVGETTRVNTSSMFGIASLSKAFTAAAIGMLVDDGKLKWEDRVVKYLPDFKLSDPVATQLLTIEDLLCHRSGLKTFDGDLLWYGTQIPRDEILRRMYHRPLSYDFRDGFGYQNIMYIAAGEVILKVSGTTWDQFLRDRIFTPLGMNKTNTTITAFKPGVNIAYPHLERVPQSLLNYDNSGAAAAMNSNVVDMQKWITFLLKGGIHENDTLLKSHTLRKLWQVHTPLGVSAASEEMGTKFKGYGLGWFLMDYKGLKVVHHGGGLPGYITKLALVPEKNLGMIILTNDNSSLSSALMYSILDMLIGEKGETKDWSTEFLSFKTKDDEALKEKAAAEDAARLKNTKTTAALDAFYGTYNDPYYGKATLGKGKKGIILTLEPAKELFTATLEHWHNDEFVFSFKDAFLPRGFARFRVEGGKVISFTIDLPNPDFHFSNLTFIKE